MSLKYLKSKANIHRLFDEQKYGIRSIQGTKIASISWADFAVIPKRALASTLSERAKAKALTESCALLGSSFVLLDDVMQIAEENFRLKDGIKRQDLQPINVSICKTMCQKACNLCTLPDQVVSYTDALIIADDRDKLANNYTFLRQKRLRNIERIQALENMLEKTNRIVEADLLHVKATFEAEKLGAKPTVFSAESLTRCLTEIQQSIWGERKKVMVDQAEELGILKSLLTHYREALLKEQKKVKECLNDQEDKGEAIGYTVALALFDKEFMSKGLLIESEGTPSE